MSFISLNSNLITAVFKEKDFSFLALTISLFLLPLSINLSTFALVAALCLKVFQLLAFKQRLFKLKLLKKSSLIGLFFLIYIVINSIVKNNLKYILSVFENEFSHLLLLILIPFLLRGKKENIILCYALFIGTIIACLYVFILSFILQINFDRDAFQNILDIHHTYLSIYLLFIINFLFGKFFSDYKSQRFLKNAIFILLISLGFLIIFVVNSKVSIIIFAIILGGYLIISFSKNNAIKYFFVFSVLTTCIVIFNNKLNVSYKSALDFRQEIWTQSVNSIKENIFFGNLNMSEKDVLNYKHYLSGKYYLMDSDLNSHNQYLSILLKYGFVGFLILILYPVNVISALNKQTTKEIMKEVFGFGIILLMIFYIENVLDRHHGIVFVSIFYNYYLVDIQNEDN